MIVRLRLVPLPARVNGKRPLAAALDALNLAANRLSTPDGVNVFSQLVDASLARCADLAANAGIITGDKTSETDASIAAAKPAFLRPKGFLADMVCSIDSLFTNHIRAQRLIQKHCCKRFYLSDAILR
jgi:hypothetical protein